MKLIFRKDNDQVLCVKENIREDTEYMYPAFNRALDILRNILDKSLPLIHNRNLSATELYGYSGNILAISGRRGQGKTSTMLSLTEDLRKCHDPGRQDDRFANVSFYPLDPIDPTVLESDQSPLMLILSRMYQKTETIWKHDLTGGEFGRHSQSEKNELSELFQRCLSGISAIKHTKRDREPSLYEIHELSDSAHLKWNFYQLTRKLLSFCETSPGRTPYLVIQLDDTDFQIERGYEIMEDLRRYLTLPNVIITMATDLDILYDVVAQHFFEKMNVALTNRLILERELRNHTHKYLDKLIPPNRIVNLPQMDLLMAENPDDIQLVFEGMDQPKLKELEKLPLHTAVFRLLYEKTGIMLLELDTGREFLPGTLRGLMQLLNLLISMEDIEQRPLPKSPTLEWILQTQKEQMERRETNLNLFEDYYTSSWLNAKFTNEKNRSDAEEEITADDIANLFQKIQVIPNEKRYGLIIQELENFYLKKENRKRGNPPDLNYPAFCEKLQELREAHPLPQDRCLFGAIRIWLTILWHKAVIRRGRKEINRDRKGTKSAVFDYTPDEIGLPFVYYQDESHTDEPKKTDTASTGITDVIDGDRFYVMNLIPRFLGGKRGENGEPVDMLIPEKMGTAYKVQQMALRVAANPEVHLRLINSEKEEVRKDPDSKKTAKRDRFSKRVEALNAEDQKIYSSTKDKKDIYLQMENSIGMIKVLADEEKPKGKAKAGYSLIRDLVGKINGKSEKPKPESPIPEESSQADPEGSAQTAEADSAEFEEIYQSDASK